MYEALADSTDPWALVGMRLVGLPIPSALSRDFILAEDAELIRKSMSKSGVGFIAECEEDFYHACNNSEDDVILNFDSSQPVDHMETLWRRSELGCALVENHLSVPERFLYSNSQDDSLPPSDPVKASSSSANVDPGLEMPVEAGEWEVADKEENDVFISQQSIVEDHPVDIFYSGETSPLLPLPALIQGSPYNELDSSLDLSDRSACESPLHEISSNLPLLDPFLAKILTDAAPIRPLDGTNTNQNIPRKSPSREPEPTDSELLAIYTNSQLTTSQPYQIPEKPVISELEAAAEAEMDDGEDEYVGPCLFFDDGPVT